MSWNIVTSPPNVQPVWKIHYGTTTSNSISSPSLRPNTRYYWKMRSLSAGATSNWTDIRSFVTTSAVSLAPVLKVGKPDEISLTATSGVVTSVTGKIQIQKRQATVYWYPIAGAAEYVIQVGYKENFTATETISGITDTQYTFTNLPERRDIRWRVKVQGQGTTPVEYQKSIGFLSSVCSIIVASSAYITAPISIPDSATSDETFLFAWGWFDNPNGTYLGASHAGIPMTKLGDLGVSADSKFSAFYLSNPQVGIHNVSLTASGTRTVLVLQAIALSGVMTADPFFTTYQVESSYATTASKSLASSAGTWMVGNYFSNDKTVSAISGTVRSTSIYSPHSKTYFTLTEPATGSFASFGVYNGNAASGHFGAMVVRPATSSTFSEGLGGDWSEDGFLHVMNDPSNDAQPITASATSWWDALDDPLSAV